MRRLLIAAPLLLASCSMFEGKSSAPPAVTQAEASSIVASAIDDAQTAADKRFSDLRATLEQLVADQARLREQLTDLRNTSREDATAALAAESTASQAQHLLLLTGIVAAFSTLGVLILGIVVIWQSVLLRRAQRASVLAELRLPELSERAAMAAAARAPGAVPTTTAATPPSGGPFARLRRRPPT